MQTNEPIAWRYRRELSPAPDAIWSDWSYLDGVDKILLPRVGDDGSDDMGVPHEIEPLYLAAPLPASPTPELNPDTARLEHVEAWLDDFQWVEVGDLAGRHVRMDWFAGDGGGHWFTQARTFREAIDQSLHGSGAEAHQLPPTITAPKSAPASPTAPPNVREAMIAADLKAPLCAKCEADDIYERSPESCAECAANRIDAILSLPASAPASTQVVNEAAQRVAVCKMLGRLPEAVGGDAADDALRIDARSRASTDFAEAVWGVLDAFNLKAKRNANGFLEFWDGSLPASAEQPK